MKIVRFRQIPSLSLNLQYVMEMNDIGEDFLYFSIPPALMLVKGLDKVFNDLLETQGFSGPFTFVEDNTLMPEVG